MKPDPSRFRRFDQVDAYSSPWSVRARITGFLWGIAWALLFRPSPKFFSRWRVFILRCFGARVQGVPFVSASARVRMPWNLRLDHRACLGDNVVVYNLGLVHLKARCTVAQEAYLCGGTHDLAVESLPLIAGRIVIGEDVFVGARAMILPGVEIADGAVIGAGSVVTKDMPAWTVCAGNPCTPIKTREFSRRRPVE